MKAKAIFFVVLSFLLLNSAYSSTTEDPEKLYHEGIILYKSGDYSNALPLFRKAREIVDTSSLYRSSYAINAEEWESHILYLLGREKEAKNLNCTYKFDPVDLQEDSEFLELLKQYNSLCSEVKYYDALNIAIEIDDYLESKYGESHYFRIVEGLIRLSESYFISGTNEDALEFIDDALEIVESLDDDSYKPLRCYLHVKKCVKLFEYGFNVNAMEEYSTYLHGETDIDTGSYLDLLSSLYSYYKDEEMAGKADSVYSILDSFSISELPYKYHAYHFYLDVSKCFDKGNKIDALRSCREIEKYYVSRQDECSVQYLLFSLGMMVPLLYLNGEREDANARLENLVSMVSQKYGDNSLMYLTLLRYVSYIYYREGEMSLAVIYLSRFQAARVINDSSYFNYYNPLFSEFVFRSICSFSELLSINVSQAAASATSLIELRSKSFFAIQTMMSMINGLKQLSEELSSLDGCCKLWLNSYVMANLRLASSYLFLNETNLVKNILDELGQNYQEMNLDSRLNFHDISARYFLSIEEYSKAYEHSTSVLSLMKGGDPFDHEILAALAGSNVENLKEEAVFHMGAAYKLLKQTASNGCLYFDNNIIPQFHLLFPTLGLFYDIANKTKNPKAIEFAMNLSLLMHSLHFVKIDTFNKLMDSNPVFKKDYLQYREDWISINSSSRKFTSYEEQIALQASFANKYSEIINSVDSMTLETTKTSQLQRLLHENEIAVDFGFGANNTFYAIILCHNSVSPIIVDLSNALDALAMHIQNETDVTSNTELYELLWKPIISNSNIESGGSIFFSADNFVIPRINIEHLPCGNLLMSEKYKVHRLSSLSELTQMGMGNNKFSSSLLFGNPEFDFITDNTNDLVSKRKGSNLSPKNRFAFSEYTIDTVEFSTLSYSKMEIENITAIMKKSHLNSKSIKVYTEKEATEEMFKRELSNHVPDILHVATHGVSFNVPDATMRNFDKVSASPNDYMSSADAANRTALLCAGSKYYLAGNEIPEYYEDGVLTSYEILNLDLRNVKLAVLSACNTASGDLYYSGLAGVALAMKLAGVKTILASTKKVDDKSTSLLMTRFYTNLLGRDMNPTDALVDAQKYVRTYSKDGVNYSDSKYWEPFIIID